MVIVLYSGSIPDCATYKDIMEKQYIRYEVHFQNYIVDDFFADRFNSYSSIAEARKAAKSEPRIRAYRIVKCTREIVEERSVLK